MQIKENLKMQKMRFWRFTSPFRTWCEMCSLGQNRIEISSPWARCGAHRFKEKRSSTRYKSIAAMLLEELALLWPWEPERLDMMKSEKIGVWKENALKNALKTERNRRKWKGTNEGFENCQEYVTEDEEEHATSLQAYASACGAHATWKQAHAYSPMKKKKKKNSIQKHLQEDQIKAYSKQKHLRKIQIEASPNRRIEPEASQNETR